MEQIIILILIFLLPGIIRRLLKTKQQVQAASRRSQRDSPAAPQVLDPSELVEPAAIEPAESLADDRSDPAEQMPKWLQELSSQLGDKEERQALAGRIFESREVSQIEQDSDPWTEPPVEEAPLQDEEAAASETTRTYLAESPELESGRSPRLPLSLPPRARSQRARELFRAPAGSAAWRRAVVLTELLGPPSALRPWREPGRFES